MFFFERIFGISIYILILLFICFFLIKINVSCKSILRVYLICLCVMAFLYKPYITADLYRIYETIDYLSMIEFDMFWNNFVVESSTPVAMLLYWCVGKIGINALLPTFSSFVCYSLIFYVINKTKELYGVSNQNVAYVLLFIMTTSIYISVIGGIRMMIALSMITYSFFRVTVEKKFNIIDIIFCIASIFIHAMSLVVIGICILVLLFDSNKSFARRILYALVTGVVGIVFMLYFHDVVNGLVQKFWGYVLGDKYSDFWEYIMGALIIIVLLILFREFRHVYREVECYIIKNYNTAAVFCIVIAICFCFEFSIFYRFGGQLAILFAIPSMMVTLEKTEGKASVISKKLSFRSILLIMSLLIAAISCTRGSLSALKFFEL